MSQPVPASLSQSQVPSVKPLLHEFLRVFQEERRGAAWKGDSHFGEVKDEVQSLVGGAEAALGIVVGRLQAAQALRHSLTDHARHASQILQHDLQKPCILSVSTSTKGPA